MEMILAFENSDELEFSRRPGLMRFCTLGDAEFRVPTQ